MNGSRYYGKYRGKVENNVDPEQLGRVQLSCAAVLGEGKLGWAMPCSPFAGKGVGWFTVPPVGANVWVEFEGGDPDYPILAGCFWATGEVPAQPAAAEMKVWKTDGVTLTIRDVQGGGGLTIDVSPPIVSTPLSLKFSSSGIELVNGASKIALASTGVSVNDGALEVV